MGNNSIRRIIKQEQKWRDKSCPKHKHNFSIHALAQINRGEQDTSYYNVMKCTKCNSFNCIERPGAADGFIMNEDLIDMSLPIIKLYTPHKWLVGWKDAVELK